MSSIWIDTGFSQAERNRVAKLYWQAFGSKLGVVLGPAARALPFLAKIMDPAFALTARSADGQLLGLAGFKTPQGSLTGGGQWRDMTHVYGIAGSLWRLPLLTLLSRPVTSGVLLMDGISVAPQARGRGVGTRLLQEIKKEARARNLYRVRLDVIDTNLRARALYEREGFVATTTEHLGPLRFVFGFRKSTSMICEIDAPRRVAAN